MISEAIAKLQDIVTTAEIERIREVPKRRWIEQNTAGELNLVNAPNPDRCNVLSNLSAVSALANSHYDKSIQDNALSKLGVFVCINRDDNGIDFIDVVFNTDNGFEYARLFLNESYAWKVWSQISVEDGNSLDQEELVKTLRTYLRDTAPKAFLGQVERMKWSQEVNQSITRGNESMGATVNAATDSAKADTPLPDEIIRLDLIRWEAPEVAKMRFSVDFLVEINVSTKRFEFYPTAESLAQARNDSAKHIFDILRNEINDEIPVIYGRF